MAKKKTAITMGPSAAPTKNGAESVPIRLKCGCQFTATRRVIVDCGKAAELRRQAGETAGKAALNNKQYGWAAERDAEALIAHFKGPREEAR